MALVLLVTGCQRGPKRASAIGEAFVGPAVLKIRSDIATQSAPVASVTHGERLEILQRHRTFFRVRTAGGAEGWADQRQLLAAADMANLKQLSALAAKLPSQGAATPRYGDMRIYTQPSTESPSFLTVKEKDRVDVLTHALMPRTAQPRTPLLPPTPKKEPLKKKAKSPLYPAIPMPKPPLPPADWEELSKTESDEAKEAADAAAAPTPTDDWSLIRTPDGQTGWTLTRRLDMAISDEVAQYAEGRRIVSYFSLGTVADGDAKKDVWLWTTVGGGAHAYDFDSLRVFIWSLRHHRYETAYIERNIAGFEPVLLEPVDFAPGGKAADRAAGKYPGFSVCIQKKDGQRYRQEFALLGNVVRFAGEKPCETPLSAQNLIASAAKPAPLALAAQDSQQPKESMLERTKKRIRSWFGK